jgi:hypothetical protein
VGTRPIDHLLERYLEHYPLYHHWIEALAGAKGAGMRDLWCLYADLADLWLTDRAHPRVLAWRSTA